MAVVSRIGMMALWLLLLVNAAFGLAFDRGLKVESKQETMACMTIDVAVKTILGLNRRQGRQSSAGTEQYDRLRSWVGMFRTSPFGREILNLVRCKVTMESIHAMEPASGGLEPASWQAGVLVVWAGEGCFSGHPGHDSENGGIAWPWRRGRDHG